MTRAEERRSPSRYANRADAVNSPRECNVPPVRDPCPKCGVRGDMACKHRAAV